MSFYGDMAAVARSVLADYGQTGSVTRNAVAGGGPADKSGGTSTPSIYPARLAVFPVSDDRIDGTNSRAGDFQVIVEALTVEIATDDLVSADFGGRTLDLAIVRLGKIAPAGVTVAYDMVCRGG